MPAPRNYTVTQSLLFLANLEQGLSDRAGHPSTKKTLAAVACRARRLSYRLSTANAKDWGKFLDAVEARPSRDKVWQLLYGSNGFQIRSSGYLAAMQQVVREYAEFLEEPCKSKR